MGGRGGKPHQTSSGMKKTTSPIASNKEQVCVALGLAKPEYTLVYTCMVSMRLNNRGLPQRVDASALSAYNWNCTPSGCFFLIMAMSSGSVFIKVPHKGGAVDERITHNGGLISRCPGGLQPE